VNTLHTMQGANGRTLSSRALRTPALALALAALLALLLTLGLGQMQTAQAQGPAIRYVDAGASGANNGSSWENAYNKLQDALDVANADSATVYEIWTAAGVYYLNDLEESFRINYDNVRLYGGFAGSETAREQRDWEANLTVLSGDIGQDDMTDAHGVVTSTAGIVGRNAYHVLYVNGADGTPVTADTVIDGFTVTGGSATLLGDPPHGSGGGLYCAGDGSDGECSPTLTNVVFSGNQANLGGGMFNSGEYGGVSSPMLSNVTFSGNQANLGGGMVNYTENGGMSSPTLSGVTFSGNHANYGGGGMANMGVSGVSSPSLTNVTFSGNQATDVGGAMFNQGIGGVSSPTLTNVTFSGNQAVNSGGAMYNLTVSGVSSPVIVNTILWGNDARYNPQVTNAGSVVPVFSYSLVQGGCPSLATCGDGMLDADPRFVQPIDAGSAPTTTGDYRLQFALQPASPAIDAGNTLSVTADTDLDGNPRVVNHIVDMGAYEAQNVFPLHAGAAGQGTVAVDPQQDVYAYGTAVTLTAQAAAGHAFAGWRGDLDGAANPAMITMTGTKAITATFTPLTYTLHAGTAGQGAVDVDPQQNEYLYGTAVTLTAQAAAGHVFAGWRGDLDGTDNPATISITGTKAITATFTPLTYSLHIGTAGQGTVDVDPQQDEYLYGTAVTLTAQADTGWTLAGWSGILFAQAASLVPNPITLIIAENTSVTATFEALSYTLSLAADPPQGGTVSGAGVYAYGVQAEANAAPAPGWLFVEWRENGARVSGDALYRFSVTGDRALTAHFRETTGEETGQQPAPHRVLLPVVIGGAQ